MGRQKVNQATWVTDWLDAMKRAGARARVVDIIDYLSEDGGCDRLLDANGGYGSADYECVHGRLPGDRCPQPAKVPHGIQGWTPNQDRRWDKPYPCDCWGEAAVKATPDLMGETLRTSTEISAARRRSRRKFLAVNPKAPWPCEFCSEEIRAEGDLVVHHRDENPLNEEYENLASSHGSCHSRYHRAHQPRDLRWGLDGEREDVATLAGATLSHDAMSKPVQIPKTPVHEVENGRKPVAGRARSRRNVSGVVSTDRY
jgi:hypothetical protein